ncbi:MAG TPA: hypothetical protein PK450_07800 [Paracoccaceae bacterium]|nr:hypothetical protein [Paracoccaceae bacterium]
MDRQLFALSLGFVACILLADRARAEETPRCGPRAEIIAQLTGNWGEGRRATGLIGTSAVMELFVSDDTGTFSLLATLPDGRSCLIAAGDNFATLAPESPGDPA